MMKGEGLSVFLYEESSEPLTMSESGLSAGQKLNNERIRLVVDFHETPISLDINPLTGRRRGNDDGYRHVGVSPLDADDPDPMVAVPLSIPTYPIYAKGAKSGLCPYYGKGIGGPEKMLLRAPVVAGLIEAQAILTSYGYKLLVVDGWRPWWTQARLWNYIRTNIVVKERHTGRLSLYDFVRVGLLADSVGSYCVVLGNDALSEEVYALRTGARADELLTAATALKMTEDEVALLYLTFQANIRSGRLVIDQDAPTAHGNGGSVDLWMIDTETGRYSNFGVPFDYVAPSGIDVSPATMDYFDRPDVTWEVYAEVVARDPVLQSYLRELGHETVTKSVFLEAQRVRRVLFHTMMLLGGSFYLHECWHFQLGNERGGKQAKVFPGNGNYCHAIQGGYERAVWGNPTGMRLARELLSA